MGKRTFPPIRPPASPSLEGLEGLGHEARETAQRLLWPGGLSARLLVLTVLFVAVAGLLILAASLATLEERWLTDRVAAGDTTVTTVNSSATQMLTRGNRRDLNETYGILSVVVEEQGVRNVYLRPAE